MQSPEEGRASAEMGSPVGVVVDASYCEYCIRSVGANRKCLTQGILRVTFLHFLSDVKFSEAGVQATTSTAEASVNTTSCK